MKKTVYEKLLKRIDGERSKNSAETDSRFELPPVDVMWEGQRTYLRNFSDFPKIMRRDPAKLPPVAPKAGENTDDVNSCKSVVNR